MQSITHTYLFGRLSVIGPDENKHDFIHKSLTSGEFVTKGLFRYGFFDIQNISMEDSDFVCGKLVKFKQLLEGEVVDEKGHKLIEGGLPHGVVAKSDFFLHYPSMIIAYRPLANRLSAYQFRDTFARLIEAGHHNFFVSVKCESVNEELEIREAILKLQIVHSVSIDVYPTNPSNREVYKNIDKRLKDLDASRLRQTLEAGERGLNKDSLLKDEIYQGLVMAVDGYGRGSIEGSMEGNQVIINTDESPVPHFAPIFNF